MTTQEPTTGGLPGTTGGALPADRDLPGVSARPEDPRPGDRLLADPREDPLWAAIGGFLPSLAPYTLDGLVTLIRKALEPIVPEEWELVDG